MLRETGRAALNQILIKLRPDEPPHQRADAHIHWVLNNIYDSSTPIDFATFDDAEAHLGNARTFLLDPCQDP